MCSTLNGVLRPGSRRFNTEPRGRRFRVSNASQRPCCLSPPRTFESGLCILRYTGGRAYSSAGTTVGAPGRWPIYVHSFSTRNARHPPHTDRNLNKVGGSHGRPSALPGFHRNGILPRH